MSKKWRNILRVFEVFAGIAGAVVLAWIGFKQTELVGTQNDLVLGNSIRNSQLWGYKRKEGAVDDEIFNNFTYGEEPHSRQEIQFLWADPFGCIDDKLSLPSEESCAKIDAFIVPESETGDGNKDGFLRIKFTHAGWGVNVAVRQQDLRLANATKFSGISIKFRSPFKEKVGIRLRVVDGNNIHWGFGEKNNDRYSYSHKDSGSIDLSTNEKEWKEVRFSLKNETEWFHFKNDGPINVDNIIPLLRFINLVVIEPGFYVDESDCTDTHSETGYCQDANKEGIIDIDEIKFY